MGTVIIILFVCLFSHASSWQLCHAACSLSETAFLSAPNLGFGLFLPSAQRRFEKGG